MGTGWKRLHIHTKVRRQRIEVEREKGWVSGSFLITGFRNCKMINSTQLAHRLAHDLSMPSYHFNLCASLIEMPSRMNFEPLFVSFIFFPSSRIPTRTFYDPINAVGRVTITHQNFPLLKLRVRSSFAMLVPSLSCTRRPTVNPRPYVCTLVYIYSRTYELSVYPKIRTPTSLHRHIN